MSIFITIALCVLGAIVAVAALAIWVAYQVIEDEGMVLDALERKHGLRDNE